VKPSGNAGVALRDWKRTRELATGYRANAALNQEISEDFIYVDADMS
jgi:hypothetical protein